MTVTAEQLERGRDLAEQDAALKAESKQDVLFMDMTPREKPIMLYARADGEPIPMPPDIARMAMRKRYAGGGYMFTADPAKAPVYKLGDVKCFLHAESPERLSGALDEVGIASVICPAEHLASKYARRIHAENRHGKRWAAFQEHMKELEKDAEREAQRQQLEATLALAGRAASAPIPADPKPAESTVVAPEKVACPDCGAEVKPAGMHLHKLRWCPKKDAA